MASLELASALAAVGATVGGPCNIFTTTSLGLLAIEAGGAITCIAVLDAAREAAMLLLAAGELSDAAMAAKRAANAGLAVYVFGLTLRSIREIQ